MSGSHLQRLEAEAIHVIREVVATRSKPVMLYSIGKDSSVLLHLARKALYPARLPFPVLHIDTSWKFKEMIAFRDKTAQTFGLELIVHRNEQGIAEGINPFDWAPAAYIHIMKTVPLREALDRYGFDAAIGGARRDEEASRSKERIFSFRDEGHSWDPKTQRPEMWRTYNTRLTRGASFRVFPLSNWTEMDIWSYILQEGIDIPSLYFADERPVVSRDGRLIMCDDERMRLAPQEAPEEKSIRFRTLGCYPLTGGMESNARTIPEIICETLVARTTERQGRLIDHDERSSMEKKKREGYF